MIDVVTVGFYVSTHVKRHSTQTPAAANPNQF